MTNVQSLISLLKSVRDSPTLGQGSNAVVVDGKTWSKIADELEHPHPRGIEWLTS